MSAYPEFKLPKLSRWTRFLLWFKPTYVVCDPGYSDYATVLFVKYLRGAMYIVREERVNR